jgi:hypothetical protein
VFFADCGYGVQHEFAPFPVPGVAAIGPDRTFSLDAKGEGTTEVKISGTFNAAGTSASGSFHAHVGFSNADGHFECDTGDRTWSAVWGGPLQPHVTEIVTDAGGLRVSFDDSGQKGRASVNYKLTASVSTSWGCADGQTVQSQSSASNSVNGLLPDRKGHVVGSIELAAPTAPSGCASATLKRVDYTDVTLTNQTAGNAVRLNSISRTYP